MRHSWRRSCEQYRNAFLPSVTVSHFLQALESVYLEAIEMSDILGVRLDADFGGATFEEVRKVLSNALEGDFRKT